MKTLQFDTEYSESNQHDLRPVCCVVSIDGEDHKYWMPDDMTMFKADWNRWMEDDLVIVCFGAIAESRFMLSLGYTVTELLSWKWADTWVWWRMLTHSHPDYKYGRKIVNGQWMTTTPPPKGSHLGDEWGEDDNGLPKIVRKADPKHSAVGTGLAAAIAHRMGIDIDAENKEAMRNLIMFQTEYSDEERQTILGYCASDVQYLLPLMQDLYGIVNELSCSQSTIQHLLQMSRYCVCCAQLEANGIPIYSDRAKALGANYYAVDKGLVEGVVTKFPFYVQRKSTKAEKEEGWGDTKWVESQKAFESYVDSCNLRDGWPATPTGTLSKSAEVLKNYQGDTTLNTFRVCKHSRGQIKYFRPEGWANIRGNMGDDGRIRVWMAPFCSKTGRNQPGVRGGYLLGMSSWIRPLIGQEGKVLIGADFSAQEIAIQGWVSSDNAFMAAYESGDPYTWFAAMAGSLPPGTTRKGGKFYDDQNNQVPPELQAEFKGVRNMFKSLLLGVGFGMGLDKLATSLTQARVAALPQDQEDIINKARVSDDPELKAKAEEILAGIRVVSGNKEAHQFLPKSQRATTYKGHHQQVFRTYWAWREKILARYKRDGCLVLPDGWTLFAGEDRQNTIANFPVQGHGACILRRAVERCLLAGLHVISPLHDAIYILSDPETADADAEALTREMKAAVVDVCSEDLIRIGAEKYHTDWETFESTWTKDKGGEEFKRFGKYMIPSLIKENK